MLEFHGNHKINCAFILNIKLHLTVQFSVSSNIFSCSSCFTCLKRQPELNVNQKEKKHKIEETEKKWSCQETKQCMN
jgi:hypothetical protein